MKATLIQKRINYLKGSYYDEFRYNYAYKMGGIFEIQITNHGKIIYHDEIDERNYYEGRGAKYNKNIRHDHIVSKMSLNRLNELYKEKRSEDKKRVKEIESRRIAEARDIEEFGCNYEYTYPTWLTIFNIKNESLMLDKLSEKYGVDLELLTSAFLESKNYEGKCNINITDDLAIYHADFSCNNVCYSFINEDNRDVENYFC